MGNALVYFFGTIVIVTEVLLLAIQCSCTDFSLEPGIQFGGNDLNFLSAIILFLE